MDILTSDNKVHDEYRIDYLGESHSGAIRESLGRWSKRIWVLPVVFH